LFCSTDIAQAAGGLRDGMTVDDAADLICATNGPEFYTLLVQERGSDQVRFERRLSELWRDLLMPSMN
jgi:hypothetical protein